MGETIFFFRVPWNTITGELSAADMAKANCVLALAPDIFVRKWFISVFFTFIWKLLSTFCASVYPFTDCIDEQRKFDSARTHTKSFSFSKCECTNSAEKFPKRDDVVRLEPFATWITFNLCGPHSGQMHTPTSTVERRSSTINRRILIDLLVHWPPPSALSFWLFILTPGRKATQLRNGSIVEEGRGGQHPPLAVKIVLNVPISRRFCHFTFVVHRTSFVPTLLTNLCLGKFLFTISFLCTRQMKLTDKNGKLCIAHLHTTPALVPCSPCCDTPYDVQNGAFRIPTASTLFVITHFNCPNENSFKMCQTKIESFYDY